MTRTTKKKITTLMLVGGLFIASYITLKYIFPLVWPFVLAYGIAVLVSPIVRFLVNKLNFHKTAATILTLCFSMVGIGVVLFFIVNGIVVQSIKFIERWPEYEKVFLDTAKNMCGGIEVFFKMDKGTIYSTVSDGATRAMENWRQNVMPTIMSNSVKTIKTMVDIIIVLVLTIMAIFFMTRDMDKYRNIGQDNIFYKEIRYMRGLISRIVKAYVRSQFIIMSVVAFVCAIGLVMIGNNYYIVIGIIIGILDALPLIGVGAVMVPWSIIYIAMGSYYKAVVLFVVFLLCYFIREYLESRLMGKHMGITPIASLVSIYVGYGLFGFLGMIVGPLVYVLIREIVGRYSNT